MMKLNPQTRILQKHLNYLLLVICMERKKRLFDDPELDELVKEIRRRHIAEKIKLR